MPPCLPLTRTLHNIHTFTTIKSLLNLIYVYFISTRRRKNSYFCLTFTWSPKLKFWLITMKTTRKSIFSVKVLSKENCYLLAHDPKKKSCKTIGIRLLWSQFCIYKKYCYFAREKWSKKDKYIFFVKPLSFNSSKISPKLHGPLFKQSLLMVVCITSECLPILKLFLL